MKTGNHDAKGRALFLDRDGVINSTAGGFVNRPEDLILIQSAAKAIHILRAYFSPIVVVTNQAGVGYGQMSQSTLDSIHARMMKQIQAEGGRIDRIYACTEATHRNPPCRKPNPGMAYEARRDFPEIDFSVSWMVGDMESDVRFGKRLGMKTVLIKNEHIPATQAMVKMADFYFGSLIEFSTWIQNSFTRDTKPYQKAIYRNEKN